MNKLYLLTSGKNVGTAFYVVALLFGLLLSGVGKANAQRVYANSQEVSTTLLASVSNPGYPVDADTSNFSTLNVTLGLLGLVSATQNVRFTVAGSLPLPTSPMMVRFAGNSSLLGLADGIVLQRTNGGINNNVGVAYTSSSLLDLLTLAGAGAVTDLVLPIPGVVGQANDGVRFQVNTTLGLALSAKLYYAFFIKAPTASGQTICSGGATTLTITNPQAGYTYRWYDSLTGGNQLQASTSLTYNVSGLTSTQTYYIEACEGSAAAAFRSGRTAVTVTVNALPAAPVFTTPAVFCSGGSTTVNISNLDGAALYRWYTIPTGGSSFFTGTSYVTPALTDTTRYYVEAYYSATGCVSSRSLVQINVNPLPAITFNSTFYACQRYTIAQLNYTAAANSPSLYSIAWTGSPSGFTNVTNAVFPASPFNITIPGTAAPLSYPGTLTLTATNGCQRSYTYTLVIQATPHPPPPSTSFQ